MIKNDFMDNIQIRYKDKILYLYFARKIDGNTYFIDENILYNG